MKSSIAKINENQFKAPTFRGAGRATKRGSAVQGSGQRRLGVSGKELESWDDEEEVDVPVVVGVDVFCVV